MRGAEGRVLDDPSGFACGSHILRRSQAKAVAAGETGNSWGGYASSSRMVTQV